MKVGLHQGSALSPLLFIIIMDVLAEEARTKQPWAMLFADDLVLVRETAEEVPEPSVRAIPAETTILPSKHDTGP